MARRYLLAILYGCISGLVLLEGHARYVGWKVAHSQPPHPSVSDLIAMRHEVPRSAVHQNERVMVALVFGQSNASNVGEHKKVSNAHVLNFYESKLYRAEDPLLGGDGFGGSVWTRLGDLLVEKRYYDTVIFIPVAVSGSVIARWQPGGDIHPTLIARIREVKASGFAITHLLWHQGETDAEKGTEKRAYRQSFHAMLSSIRQEGVAAPAYVSVATRCGRQRPTPSIRDAQAELVNFSGGVYAGPDTDTLGFEYRFDGCHFLDEGLDAAARLWLEALTHQPVVATP